METSTAHFENEYGHKPRGYGYWFFKITGTDNRGAYTTEEIGATGRFGEAKIAAVRKFKSISSRIKKVVLIEVML